MVASLGSRRNQSANNTQNQNYFKLKAQVNNCLTNSEVDDVMSIKAETTHSAASNSLMFYQ